MNLTIDIQELRKKTATGKVSSVKRAEIEEKAAKAALQAKAKDRFDTILPDVIDSINTQAAEGKFHFDLMILARPSDQSLWEHKEFEVKTSCISGLNFLGSINKNTIIRKLDENDLQAKIVRLSVKKIAQYFLKRNFNVSLAEKVIDITREFQRSQHYKSSEHTLDCVRISWKE